jgi:hypothetical protein
MSDPLGWLMLSITLGGGLLLFGLAWFADIEWRNRG